MSLVRRRLICLVRQHSIVGSNVAIDIIADVSMDIGKREDRIISAIESLVRAPPYSSESFNIVLEPRDWNFQVFLCSHSINHKMLTLIAEIAICTKSTSPHEKK